MGETIAFSMAVAAILYLLRWMWLNDKDVESNKAKPFGPKSNTNEAPRD